MTQARFVSALIFALALPLAFASCGQETGIPTRHIHGIVSLPPLGLWEAEPTPRSQLAEDNNDTLETAGGPFSITHAYHRIRGTADGTCAAISVDDNTVDCSGGNFGSPADEDYFRIRANYVGPIVFKARMVGEDTEGDVDIEVTDGAGAPLFADSNDLVTSVDEDGNAVLDEEGNEVQEIAPPRFSTQVTSGDEFVVKVTVNASASEAEYDLIVVGNDPRVHLIESGIEGDSATFDIDSLYPEVEGAYEIKVGSFLENDLDSLGNPVGGTTCKSWTLDEPSETFWCAWDMHFLQQVTVEANVLIDGMGDGKDNDCDGTSDTGTGTEDADGDGYSSARGDCNDTDPEVHPHRGDTAGDRKDNDCDGWADNGPDDVDDDGDGYCENGVDLNGDGVCRLEVEVNSGFGVGDCNDQDPAIYPGLSNEIPWNSIDDDCSGGDENLDFTANRDEDGGQLGGLPHEWGDLEEEACGTNPYDGDSEPVDLDEDGLCDSPTECIGTVDCPQDLDGDGFHNWVEVLCGSDPETANAAMPDFDGDGDCDGEDSDADGDGFDKLTPSGGSDCNDQAPAIHPHSADEQGNILAWNYDIPDGIDNDCDGLIDENRDWRLTDNGFEQDPDYETVDQDGDGYTLSLRDCDDTDPTMHIGNYEVHSANVVRTDFDMIYLFAGDVVSLNTTLEQPDARRVTELVPFDLQKDRVGWELSSDWPEGEPPALSPTGMPELQAWYAKQPEIGKIWYEATDETGAEIPNDMAVDGFTVEVPPTDPTHWQELGESAGAGKTNEIHGEIASIEADSWSGDNDTFHITFPEAGHITAELDWDSPGGDYDARFVCYFFNAVNPASYYVIPFDPSLADLSKPEEGTTTVELPDGADCYAMVVGYAGTPGAYTLRITPQGSGDD